MNNYITPTKNMPFQNLIIESDANIDMLNGEPFVDNYIWDAEEEFVSVVGEKVFQAPVGKSLCIFITNWGAYIILHNGY